MKPVIIKIDPRTLDNCIKVFKEFKGTIRKRCVSKKSTAEDFFNFGSVVSMLQLCEYIKAHKKELK